MPSKQQEFYDQLRQETETKVQTYREFQEQVEQIKASSAKKIDALKVDMKFISRQIESNNQMLGIQGLETVKFDK